MALTSVLGLRREPLGAVGAWIAILLFYGGALVVLYVAQGMQLNGTGLGPASGAVALAILLIGELLLSRTFELQSLLWTGKRYVGRGFVLLGLAARVLGWAVAVVMLIHLPARPPADTPQIRGMAPEVWGHAIHSLIANPWLTALVVVGWLLVVHVVVVRKQVLRGVLLMATPLGVVALLLLTYYHAWLPGPTAAEVSAQAGVSVLFDATKLTDPAERQVWSYSRKLIVLDDDQHIFVSFGDTLGEETRHTPNVWRIDVETGAYETRLSRQVRAFVHVPDRDLLFIAPWHTYDLLLVDPDRFEEQERIGIPHYWSPWGIDPPDAVGVGPYVFFSLGPFAALGATILRLDTRDMGTIVELNLDEHTPIKRGDLCCGLSISRDGETLYVNAGTRGHSFIAVVDVESMSVKGFGRTNFLGPKAAYVDGSVPGIYNTDEMSGALWRMDLETYEMEFVCDIPPRSLVYFDKYDDRLVIVDQLGGRVLRARMDCEVEATFAVGQRPSAVYTTPRGVYVVSKVGILLLERNTRSVGAGE